MSKVKNFLSGFFCFEKLSPEWILYLIIIIILIIFFGISCYNADRLIRFNDNDTDIRIGVNVAIECIIIFIGFYLLMIWKQGTISKLQTCFCGHIAIFLILTGAAAIAATAKYIEQNGIGQKNK